MVEKVPIPYQVMLEYFYQLSFRGRIEAHKIRKTITWRFRMPRQVVTKIFKELKDMNLIMFEDNRYVKILWRPAIPIFS